MPTVIFKGKEVILDEPDLELLEKHSWSWSPQGYLITKIPTGEPYGRRSICIHRMILGDPPGVHVDHINRNKSDNRRLNLRPCSASENNCNKLRYGRGVSYNPHRKKYQVVVRLNGKLKWLGYFLTEEEALSVSRIFFENNPTHFVYAW